MMIVLRIALAIAALILGNMIIPDGDVAGTFADAAKPFEWRMFAGTALIVAGAFLLSRTTVGFIKSVLRKGD